MSAEHPTAMALEDLIEHLKIHHPHDEIARRFVRNAKRWLRQKEVDVDIGTRQAEVAATTSTGSEAPGQEPPIEGSAVVGNRATSQALDAYPCAECPELVHPARETFYVHLSDGWHHGRHYGAEA